MSAKEPYTSVKEPYIFYEAGSDDENTSDGGMGLATISRLLRIIGLFCKRAL